MFDADAVADACLDCPGQHTMTNEPRPRRRQTVRPSVPSLPRVFVLRGVAAQCRSAQPTASAKATYMHARADALSTSTTSAAGSWTTARAPSETTARALVALGTGDAYRAVQAFLLKSAWKGRQRRGRGAAVRVDTLRCRRAAKMWRSTASSRGDAQAASRGEHGGRCACRRRLTAPAATER